MTDLYVHLGYPKTGTTTLQKHLFPTHPDIEYLGKFIPGFNYSADGMLSEIQQLMNSGQLKYKGVSELKKIIINCREKANRKSLLISSESFLHVTAADMRVVAQRVYDAFYPCKVIIVLREQRDILRSFYGMHGRFGQYLFLTKNELETFNIPISMEQWLSICFNAYDRNFPALLHYNEVVSCYSDLFGSDNVGLFLYEDLKNNFCEFVYQLCDFMNIDYSDGLDLLENKVEHSAISKGELLWWHFARFLRSRSRSDSMHRRENNIFYRYLSRTSRVPDAIPDVWENRINQLYSYGNRTLEETRGLPLSKYGYST